MTQGGSKRRRSPGWGIIALVLLASRATPEEGWCGTDPSGSASLLALHRYWQNTGAVRATATAAGDRDEGDIAILEDHSDLVVRRNPFVLDGASIRLSPNRSGGYDAARLAISLDGLGSSLGLGAGDARSIDLPFAFPFYGRSYSRLFVNADGNLTFGTPDTSPGERGLARFLSGPPRIAAFFATLDPGRGGQVTMQLLSDRAIFLWKDVPGGAQINHNTFEIALHPDGTIDLVYGAHLETREAIVGVSPGGTLDVTPADFSAPGPAGSSGALAERFSETEKIDLVSVTQRFLTSHPDIFEQVIIYTTRPLNPFAGTLAFEINVKNDIKGIGVDTLDDSAQWGSPGGLASVIFMDSIDSYLNVDGFEILGHEVEHRWLARIRFRDRSGSVRSALLGRGLVHWSFFMNSDASDVEGNRIAEVGGGRFETVDITRGYSALDQYAMGLRSADEVAPFFYVEAPDNFRPDRGYKSSSAPEAGVSFTGVRRDVTIDDVISAMGPRLPDASHAPRLLRQAFILVADSLAPATQERRSALARIRSRFEPYYKEATGGRGVVDSHLP